MIRVDLQISPLKSDSVQADVAPNQSIAEIVGRDISQTHSVLANGYIVPRSFYKTVRFKDHTHLDIRPMPGAIGGAIAAAVGLTGGAAAAAAIAINIVTAIALGFVSNLLFAPDIPGPGTARNGFGRLNALTGTQNRIAAFSPIPKLFGRYRYFPPVPVSAKPYTEQAGETQYLRVLLLLTSGKMDIGGYTVGAGHPVITEADVLADTLGQRPITIGETDIAEFDEVEYEIGPPDQMTLYTDQIIESAPGWTTSSDASGYASDSNPTITDNLTTTRTTETDITEFSLDLSGRLYTIDSKGNFSKLRVNYQIEWRETGTTGAWASDTFQITDNHGVTSVKTYRVANLSPAQYDVRLTRVSTYFSNLEGPPSSEVEWTALRSIRNRRAFAVDDTVVMAIRIKATDQLNGRLEKLSVLGTAVLPVYDTTANAWIEQATTNPAWAFAEVLTGASNRSPIDKTELDLNSLLAWANDNAQYGLHYNKLLDDQASTLDRIREITTAGRAAFNITSDTSANVIRDTANQEPRLVISPRNSFGYSYSLSAFNPPQALKVRFVNEQTWQDDERIVYDDGQDATNTDTRVALEAVGCTHAEQAYKFGRYHLANQRLRGIEKHEFSMDAANLHFERGDIVTLQNTQILVGLAAGRVKSTTVDANGDVTGFESDEFLPMATAVYACRFQTANGDIFVATVKTNPGTAVEFAAPLSHALLPDTHFVFGEAGKVSTDLKVVKIARQGDLQARITCEPAAPNILAGIDGPIPEFNPNITQPIDPHNYPPAQPTIVSVRSDETVAVENDDGTLTWRVAVTVRANSGPVSTENIQVGVRLSNEPEQTFNSRVALDNVAYFTGYNPGDLIDIQVRSVSNTGVPSKYVREFGYQITGRVPPAPTGLSITRHTFSADIDPLGGKPGSKYEFYLSGVYLDPANIETNATRLNAQPASSWTANGLDPDTTYYAHARTRNIYAASAFVSQQFTTLDDASALLKAVNARLTESELAAALSGRIDLIDAPATVIGSVNQRVEDRISAVQGATTATIATVEQSVASEEDARVQQYNLLEANKADLNASGLIIENGEVAIDAAHGPFAQATKQVSINDGDSIATLQEQFTAQRSDIGGLQATWTVRIKGTTTEGDPVAGGLGLGASGGSTRFIVDADEIAFGKINQSGLDYPFYFDSATGRAIVKNANIGELTFTKLKDSTGTFIVGSDGKIQGSYLNIDNLQVNYSAVFGNTKPLTFRLISGRVGTGQPNQSGLYDTDGTALTTTGRSYTLGILDRATRTWDSYLHYDLYGDPTPNDGRGATEFRDALNALSSDKIVAIYTHDEPRKNHTSNGVDAAMYRCGASRTIYGSGNFKYRSAYILVGIPGIGEGNGLELYSDSWVETAFTVDGNGDVQLGRTNVRDAVDISYSDGSVVNDLKPAEANANITENRTANDVQTGGGRAVVQHGADVTGSHTSYDTARVDGTTASTVRARATDGYNAKIRTDQWTRPTSTQIDGNQIYTGDAYVDTLQIKGHAVTFPETGGSSQEFSRVNNNFPAGTWVNVYDYSLIPKTNQILVSVSPTFACNSQNYDCTVWIRIRNGARNLFNGIVGNIYGDTISKTLTLTRLDKSAAKNSSNTYYVDVMTNANNTRQYTETQIVLTQLKDV